MLLNKKKGGDYMSEMDVKEWIHLLESSLALSSWMKSKSINRKDLIYRIEIVEASARTNPSKRRLRKTRQSFFQRQIRRYMRRFKKLVNREKGEGLDLVKFHQLLHYFKYVLHHGSPANFDGSRPEAVGKFLIKNPGKRTQIRLAQLTRQTAHKLVEQRNLLDFAKNCLRLNPHAFQSDKLYDLFLFPSDVAEEDDDNVDDDSEEKNDDYELSGSTYDLFYSRNQTRMRWTSGMDYNIIWSKELFRGLSQKLYENIMSPGGCCKYNTVLKGFCSMKVKRNGETNIYHAHPCYRSGLPWFDWVMINWAGENDVPELIPAKLLMILDFSQLDDDEIVYDMPEQPVNHSAPDNIDLGTSLTDQAEPVIANDTVYLVVHSARNAKEPINLKKHKYFSRLANHLTLEEHYSIVSLESLVGPAYVVANTPYTSEDDQEKTRDYIHVADSKSWSKHFINRDDSERIGHASYQMPEDPIEPMNLDVTTGIIDSTSKRRSRRLMVTNN